MIPSAGEVQDCFTCASFGYAWVLDSECENDCGDAERCVTEYKNCPLPELPCESCIRKGNTWNRQLAKCYDGTSCPREYISDCTQDIFVCTSMQATL